MTSLLPRRLFVAAMALAVTAGLASGQPNGRNAKGRGPIKLHGIEYGNGHDHDHDHDHGNPAAQRGHSGTPQASQIGFWADLLAAEAEQARQELNGYNIQPVQKMVLAFRVNKLAAETAQFKQTAARIANPGQLSQSHRSVDQAINDYASAVGAFARDDQTAARTLTRVRYADERLHAALAAAPIIVAPPPAPVPQPQPRPQPVPQPVPQPSYDVQNTARLVNALMVQANALGSEVREATAGQPSEAVRSVAAFADHTKDLAGLLNQGNPDAVSREFDHVTQLWRLAAGDLHPLGEKFYTVRIQAAHVDSMVRELSTRFVGNGPVVVHRPPQPQPQPRPSVPQIGVVSRSQPSLVVVPDAGGGPRVQVYHDLAGKKATNFFAYDQNFRGGVRAAVADLNGDDVPDVVTAPGPGMPPLIRVFDGRDLSLITEFLAHEQNFTSGLYVAAADLTDDGRALVAVGTDGRNVNMVKVFDLAAGKEAYSFSPYHAHNRIPVRVALADLTGDGTPDLVTVPGPGLDPLVRVYDGRTQTKLTTEFLAFEQHWQGGLFVAVGNAGGKGRQNTPELIVGTDAGGPARVRTFDLQTGKQRAEYTPYHPRYAGGVRVAVFDVDRNGTDDIVCAPGGGGGLQGTGRIVVYNAQTGQSLDTFEPFEPGFNGGIFIAGR